MPMTARARISCQLVTESAPSPAATAKITNPHCRTPLRPKRSPIAPPGSNSPAKHNT